MRPTFIFTFLAAASLVFPSTGSGARESDAKPAAVKAVPQEQRPLTKEEEAEAGRLAREERAREEEKERLERERQCIIKPVMTDAEIARCKEVWR